MRQLIGVRLFESGSSNKTLNIGLGRRAVATSANFRNAQHIRHNEIGSGEPVFHEPFVFAQYGLHVRKPAIQPARQAIFTISREPEEPPGNGHHLDRVERGDYPLGRFSLAARVAWHQNIALARQV
jgi:hypothetical protein